MDINSTPNNYQIVALFTSKIRHPVDRERPRYYRVAYHQELKYRSAFQAPSTLEMTVSLQEFQSNSNSNNYWVPTINDHILIFVIDLETFTTSGNDLGEYLLLETLKRKNITGAELCFIGQLMLKPQQNIAQYSVFITAQDVNTTGLRRHVRGFKKAIPQIFGSREKELAVAAVSTRTLDTALRSFYNRQNFIGFKNAFESFREESSKEISGWSVGLNSDGVEEYTDMQRRNLLFNSYEFDGLSTVLSYNFQDPRKYKLRDYDSGKSDALIVDLIEARSDVTTIPFSTKYVIAIREHTIESDYFFNFGGNDGYEVYEQPGTSMDRIFGATWTSMMEAFKENSDKALIEKYKAQIKFELDKLACYRIFRDIMQMSQIMASTHGLPIIKDSETGVIMCRPGLKFEIEVINNLTVQRNIAQKAKDRVDDLEYIASRVEVREFAQGSEGNRESNIYLVLVPKSIRELFNTKDIINQKEDGRSLEYQAKFYNATKWLRMPDIVGKSKDAANDIDVVSIPSRVSEEFYKNIDEYKGIYLKQLFLAGLGNIDDLD